MKKNSLLLWCVLTTVRAWGESEAEIALRVGKKNIASFQRQTELMIVAWQEACKIDKACSQADQEVLKQVYSYYTDKVKCSGNTAFLKVAPDDIGHMITEGYDKSRAGYDLDAASPKECFASDTTVMAAGDLDFGVQNVREEFAIVPSTGGKVIYITATFDIGWDGNPLENVTSIYRYEFDEAGKISTWQGHYDPIFAYDALRHRSVGSMTAEAPARSAGGLSDNAGAGLFAAGAVVGSAATLLAIRIVGTLRAGSLL